MCNAIRFEVMRVAFGETSSRSKENQNGSSCLKCPAKNTACDTFNLVGKTTNHYNRSNDYVYNKRTDDLSYTFKQTG